MTDLRASVRPAEDVAARRRLPWGDEALIFLAGLAGMSMLLRDGFAAVWRWGLDSLGLPFVWFLPDLLAFVVVCLFVYEFALRRAQPLTLIALSIVFISIPIAWITVDKSLIWLAMAGKMILPLLAGWALAGHSLTDRTWIRRICVIVAWILVAGVYLDQAFDLPWEGFQVSQFGNEKVAYKEWWINGVVRIGGLSGDSTTTSLVMAFSYLLVHRHLSRLWSLALAIAIILATLVTTSRTGLGVMVFVTTYVFCETYLFAGLRTLKAHRAVAAVSFTVVVMPLLLYVLVGPMNLGELSPDLKSFETRIDHSWIDPFIFLFDTSPVSLLFGCGLGCMSYPMDFSNWSYFAAEIDHWWLLAYMMFGAGALILVFAILAGLRFEDDRTKLLMLAAFNLAGMTIEMISPSFALFCGGYAMSAMHLVRFGSATRSPDKLPAPTTV